MQGNVLHSPVSKIGKKYRRKRKTKVTIRVSSIEQIISVMTNRRKYPSPVRPVGSDSGNTRATGVQQGTLLDMTGLNKILKLTPQTVTVQAGVRMRDLAEHLAEHGRELIGGYDFPDRTVGGVISSGALTADIPNEGGHLSSSVHRVTFITAQGHTVEIGENFRSLLPVVRFSYGLVGVIYSVELRTRDIHSYVIRNRKFKFDELAAFVPELATVKAGVKIFLLPFRNSAFVEIRQSRSGGKRIRKLPWQIKDWATNAILPGLVHSVGRLVPIGKFRDPLIDRVSEATQSLVSSRLVSAGSNSMEQTGQFRKLGKSPRRIEYGVWLFPANRFDVVIPAFREFCRRHYKETGFRCDLPAIAYRIDQDNDAWLSPTFAQTLFALNVRSTNMKGWENFLLEYAEFSAHFRAVPLFNQTRTFTPGHVANVFGRRLEEFRKMRKHLDPQNRLLNQFFSEHIG
jgi:hypothetical protein